MRSLALAAIASAILLRAALPARADGMADRTAGAITAGGSDCGGDAFSSAVVIERRPARRGPISAGPDTLCADLTPQQPPTRVDITANPILLPRNGLESGSGGPMAPYDGRPPFAGGPPRPRRP